MSRVKFGNVVKDVKINIDPPNPYDRLQHSIHKDYLEDIYLSSHL